MPISLSKEAQALVDAAMASGKYASQEAVLEAAVKLLTTYDEKVGELRASLQAAIARGGSLTDDEVEASIEAELDAWERDKQKNMRAAE